MDKEDKLQSLDIVELNPDLDEEDRTASKAVEIIEKSLLKEKITASD